MAGSRRIEFVGSGGDLLAAKLDMPAGRVRAYGIFAHCFTCSKDLFASQRIASELASRGIAILRFDFTGLGASGGEFANTNFSSNIDDLRRAAAFLAAHHGPAEILIGHSLGGAAVLAAGSYLPDVKAVVAIAAPADAEHVVESFKAHVPAIEMHGEAEVELAGRPFRIRRQFLDDIRDSNLETHVRNLRRPLLILHSPVDETVGVENARRIFVAARHPKSFVALDGADHLLTRRADAIFVADLVSSWCSRYLAAGPGAQEGPPVGVQVEARGEGRFQQAVQLGAHQLTLDEPRSYGGLDSGPSPYDLLAAALGACTSMTLGLYAERKGFSFPPFVVRVDHAKVHAADCVACVEGRTGLINRFAVRIVFASDLGAELRAKALAIAAKCPVHRTLTSRSHIDTVVESSTEVHAYDAPHGRN